MCGLTLQPFFWTSTSNGVNGVTTVDLSEIRNGLTPDDLARADRLAKRYNIAADAAALAVWAEKERAQMTSDQINRSLRVAAGYWTSEDLAPAGETHPPAKRRVTANAGDGANSVSPGGESTAVRMNRFIRQRGKVG
jgi:hypothetical protein